MSDDNKLSLTGRGTLGVGKGREAGKARQSFSHGRSKPVVVEKRRKRVLRKGPESESSSAAQEPTAAEPKPVEAAREAVRSGSLTPEEAKRRMEAVARQEEARKVLEEERKRLEEEAVRRAEEERRRKAEEEALRQAAEAKKREEADSAPSVDEEVGAEAGADAETISESDTQAKRLAEEAARRAADEKKRRKAEAEARRKTEAEEQEREQARKKSEARKPKGKRGEEEDEASKRRSGRGRGDERRRQGKLSVTKPFDDEEGRRKSLAAYRRAQAKRHGAQKQGPQEKQKREVIIPEIITVQELSNRMAEKAPAVIKTLMGMDVMATINDNLDQDTAELVVTEMGHVAKRVSESDVEIGLIGPEDAAETLKARPPVVTVMGHVDHGKTSVLDALREANVVAGEAGGITQHIGAYQIELPSGDKVTFLDTPGHEAFTEMRSRGASVTDIVVVVVAADDGIMPQTIEAINHARAAGVPIIIAINKIDLPGADPDRVRQELLQHDIQVEAMGGDVLDVEISALKRQNLDRLIEAIALQSELLELKANPDRPAEGVVVEAKLERGRGSVATVLIKRGTLRVGDVFVAGAQSGKVRALMDERGQQIEQALPAQPVEVLGLNGTPSAGDEFAVVEDEARAREIAEYRQSQQRQRRQGATPASVESMFSQLKEEQAEEFPVVIKGDVQGSVEAIVQALEKIGAGQIRAKVLHAAVGGITETDVSLASASRALIIGFNVRANKQAREAAERDGVPIKYYSVIYNLVDEVKAAMAGQLGPAIEETAIGHAEVRDVFTAGKAGRAAGCFVTEGIMRKGAQARLLRDDTVVYTGRISSLRRFKDDVDEVKSGTECGVTLENFQDIKAGDRIEVYESREVDRVL